MGETNKGGRPRKLEIQKLTVEDFSNIRWLLVKGKDQTEIATYLNVNVRTLRRHLAKNKSSYFNSIFSVISDLKLRKHPLADLILCQCDLMDDLRVEWARRFKFSPDLVPFDMDFTQASNKNETSTIIDILSAHQQRAKRHKQSPDDLLFECDEYEQMKLLVSDPLSPLWCIPFKQSMFTPSSYRVQKGDQRFINKWLLQFWNIHIKIKEANLYALEIRRSAAWKRYSKKEHMRWSLMNN